MVGDTTAAEPKKSCDLIHRLNDEMTPYVRLWWQETRGMLALQASEIRIATDTSLLAHTDTGPTLERAFLRADDAGTGPGCPPAARRRMHLENERFDALV